MYCNVFVSCNNSKCINIYSVIIGNINIISQKAGATKWKSNLQFTGSYNSIIIL